MCSLLCPFSTRTDLLVRASTYTAFGRPSTCFIPHSKALGRIVHGAFATIVTGCNSAESPTWTCVVENPVHSTTDIQGLRASPFVLKLSSSIWLGHVRSSFGMSSLARQVSGWSRGSRTIKTAFRVSSARAMCPSPPQIMLYLFSSTQRSSGPSVWSELCPAGEGGLTNTAGPVGFRSLYAKTSAFTASRAGCGSGVPREGE